MQRALLATVAFALGVSCLALGADLDTGSQGAVSPLQKVANLLTGMREKINKDGGEEDKHFKAFTEWCETSSSNLKYEIKTGASDIEESTATIAKADADISASESKIEDLAASQAQTEAALQAAVAIREKDHHEFSATEAELLDSIDTVERASNVLQRKAQGASLMETSVNGRNIKEIIRSINEVVNAAALSLHDQQKLMSLTQSSEDDEEDDFSGVFDDAKKGHSSSILDLLEDLKQKAEDQLAELRAEETSGRHSFELERQSMADQIDMVAKELSQANIAKSIFSQTRATSAGDLSVTKKDLETDKAGLADMNRECVSKAIEYDASVKARNEELQAIELALKALSDVSGASAFLELKTSNPDRFRVVNALRKLAQDQQSAVLTQLAGRVSTVVTQAAREHDPEPFQKVKEMIVGMVERLTKEGESEATHKDYCDKEIAESESKKEDLQHTIEKQSASIDKAKAKSADLRDQITTLTKELADMAKQQGESDRLRIEEKTTFTATQSDLQRGIEGIRLALKTLHQHYGQSTAAVFAQSFRSGPIKGVFSLLELVEEDLTKELAKIKEEERNSARAYEKLTQEHRIAKVVKDKSLKYKEKESASLGKALAEYNSDLDGSQTEMDAILDYARNIHGQCTVKEESYPERKARRQQEIAGLRQTLAVLDEQVSLLQRKVVRRRSALRGVAMSPQ